MSTETQVRWTVGRWVREVWFTVQAVGALAFAVLTVFDSTFHGSWLIRLGAACGFWTYAFYFGDRCWLGTETRKWFLEAVTHDRGSAS